MPRKFITVVHDDPKESERDAVRKECFELCAGCRHGHPLDLATGAHTKRYACNMHDRGEIEALLGRPMTNEEVAQRCPHCKAGLPFDGAATAAMVDKTKHVQVTKCAALKEREELAAMGGHTITEVP